MSAENALNGKVGEVGMKAVIHLDVPEWQIGQEVTVYFPDTMQKRGVCELLKEQEELLKHEYWRGYNNGRADERGLQEGTIMQTFSPD